MNQNIKTLFTRLALVASALLFAAAPSVFGAAGDLDPTFGIAGKMTTGIFSGGGYERPDPRAIAVQKDGKIIVAGKYLGVVEDFMVLRYHADGSLDTDFGSNGLVLTDFFGQVDEAGGVIIQQDGKIVAGGFATLGLNPMGETNTAFALARYNPDGSLDSTFGVGGKVTTDFLDNLDHGTGVLLQADGKIILSGWVTQGPNDGTTYDFAVARYNSDGTLDTTFGDQGKTFTDFNGNGDRAEWAVLQSDGKIVLAGHAFSPVTHSDFALARYLANGSLDPTFNGTGKVTTNFAGDFDELAWSVALAPDGKIVAGGWADNGPIFTAKADFAVARYHPDGTLDTTFDSDGKWARDISGTNESEYGRAITVLRNGKIVIAGSSHFRSVPGGGSTDFAVIQLKPNGSFDNRFGSGGIVYTDFGEFKPGGGVTGDSAEAIFVQRDGKILVAGTALFQTALYHAAIARYLGR